MTVSTAETAAFIFFISDFIMIKILPLGGAGEIGASCFHIEIEGTGIIIDCGMHPLKIGWEALPKFELLEDRPVDYLLISHAHQDHLSALPYLVKNHPYIKIITTPQTRALAELTLHNSVSILKEQVGEDDSFKIYSHDEIDLLIKTIGYRAYGEKFEVNGYKHKGSNSITAEFYDAGHILGSAGILLKYKDESLFYSGDINMEDQALLPAADLPGEKVNTLMIETTYGATDSFQISAWKEEAGRFASRANSIFNKGGSILIPVFSLGKMQEILATIHNLMKEGRLTNADIYTGGIANKISRVYDYNRYVVRRIDNDFELNSVPQKNIYEVKNSEEFFKSPSIVLAPSGMMIKGTASYNLAKDWFGKNTSAIFTVGYMEPSTPGYKISRAKKGEKIQLEENGREFKIKCEIEQFRFSAHSKREDLLKLVKKLNPANVLLVHGDPPAIDWMGYSILKNSFERKVYAAEIGKRIIIA